MNPAIIAALVSSAPSVLQFFMPGTDPASVDPLDEGQQSKLVAAANAKGIPLTNEYGEILLSLFTGDISGLAFDDDNQVDTVVEFIVDQVWSRILPASIMDPIRGLVGLPPVAAGLTSATADQAPAAPANEYPFLGQRLGELMSKPVPGSSSYNLSVLPEIGQIGRASCRDRV